MVDIRTEDEQIEAVKDWWKRNGTSLLMGIVLAVALLLGWQAWQNNKVEQRMAAAQTFQELFTALNTPDTSGEGHQDSTIRYTADQLRSEHGETVHAVLGSLLEAKYLVLMEEFPDAVESLEWALEHAGAAPMPVIVRERLARAQFAAGDHDLALETLDGVQDAGAFAGIYHELKGDILKASGDIEGAREAYLAASEASADGGRGTLLEYKMADLSVSGDA